jgi:hypothetical protein
MRRASRVTQLVERDEDDLSGRTKLGLKYLDHGDSLSIDLQDSPFGAGRGIVDRLDQFDDVELSDFVSYCHLIPILGGWISRDQSWCRALIRVMPGDFHQRFPALKSELNPGSAGESKWGSITNLFDPCGGRCLEDRIPNESPVVEADVEDAGPFRVLSAREWFADIWWPSHRLDAMKWRRTCVRLRPNLRVEKHTEGAQR